MHALYAWLWYLVPANPLVVRIVENASRRQRHLWVRMSYLGGLILLVLLGLLYGGGMAGQQSLTDLAKAGTKVFVTIAYGQVILVCLLAPLFMAAAIASEQSGRTYNILLTTPLTNLQIVLGSLLGRLFLVWALLASGLPLFAILLIFGGVPIRSVFVAFGVAALTALMVGSVAITLAVLRAGGRKAVFAFVIAVAAYLVAFYALDVSLRSQLAVMPGGSTWLTPLHPLLVLETAINTANYRPPPVEALGGYGALTRFYLSRPFGAFAALTLLGSLVLITWSSLQLRRVGQRDESRTLIGRLKKLLTGVTPGGERRRRAREVWANPIAWREASTRGNRAAALLARWAFLLVGLLVACLLLWLYHSGRLAFTNAAGTVVTPGDVVFRQALTILVLVEVAVIILVAVYMSAGSITREREDGTLDLLLTTPITPRYYIWGKLRGLVSFLTLLVALPVLTLAIVSAYTLIGDWAEWPQVRVMHGRGTTTKRDLLILPEAPILLAGLLMPCVSACVILGVKLSLTKKTVLAAVTWAVAVVGVVVAACGSLGWAMATSVEVLGPVANAFVPFTSVLMIISPWEHLAGFITDPFTGRFMLLMSIGVVSAVYGGIVWGTIQTMVGSFDQTVRKLTGTA